MKYLHGVGGGGYFPVDPKTDAIGTVVPWRGLRAIAPASDQSNEVVYADDEDIYDSYAGVATDNLKLTGYKTPEEAWGSFGKRKVGSGFIRDSKAYAPFGCFYREQTEVSGVYNVTIYYKLNGTTPTGEAGADEDKRTIRENEHNAIAVPNSTVLDDKGQPSSIFEFTVDTNNTADPNLANYRKLYPVDPEDTRTIPKPTDFIVKPTVTGSSIIQSGAYYNIVMQLSGEVAKIKLRKGTAGSAVDVAKPAGDIDVTSGATSKSAVIDGTKVTAGDKVNCVPYGNGGAVGVSYELTIPSA